MVEWAGDFFLSDNLLRLGWLDNPTLVTPCLTALAEKAAEYKGKGVFEFDTRAFFVEPLLRGLGWDTLDRKQVGREYPSGRNMIGDIWLGGTDHKEKWKLAAVIETKALDADSRGMQKAYTQLRGDILNNLFSAPPGIPNERYRVQLGGKAFVRGVLTNGCSWIVYDFDPGVPEHHKPLCKFDLVDGSEHVVQFVRAIGRPHLVNKFGLS